MVYLFCDYAIPWGWSLDRFGPRLTASVMLAFGGGGGAAVFAMATSPLHVQMAMCLIGIGCAYLIGVLFYFCMDIATHVCNFGRRVNWYWHCRQFGSAAPLAIAAETLDGVNLFGR